MPLSNAARIHALAIALKMEPTRRTNVELEIRPPYRWWLVGCVDGDQPLPCTAGARTIGDALDAAEAWLAPELEGKKANGS